MFCHSAWQVFPWLIAGSVWTPGTWYGKYVFAYQLLQKLRIEHQGVQRLVWAQGTYSPRNQCSLADDENHNVVRSVCILTCGLLVWNAPTTFHVQGMLQQQSWCSRSSSCFPRCFPPSGRAITDVIHCSRMYAIADLVLLNSL